MLEAAVTNDGATRSIDMFHKMDGARADNPKARMIAVKEFFDANGDAILGAVEATGGPRAHLGGLELICDIASAENLSRPIQSNLERLHNLLAKGRALGAAYEDATDQSREEVGLIADRLAKLLVEIGPARQKADLSEWLARRV